MTNPLNSAPKHIGHNTFADMAPGETRTAAYVGKAVRDAGYDMLTQTITRTDRPFIYDWVDGSNQRLAEKGSGYVWIVDEAGGAQLVSRRHYRGAERTERRKAA